MSLNLSSDAKGKIVSFASLSEDMFDLSSNPNLNSGTAQQKDSYMAGKEEFTVKDIEVHQVFFFDPSQDVGVDGKETKIKGWIHNVWLSN